MSSMTDVIFLLLIFFVVTSTIIFPAAIDVNLPQSSEQTTLKPVTEVYIDAENNIYLVADRNAEDNPEASAPKHINKSDLARELSIIQSTDSLRAIALYADSTVSYARVIDILDLAARNNLRMVLATRASQTPAMPAGTPEPETK